MFITVPTSAQIGTTLERIARIAAILIAATMAAGFITRQTLTGLATLARNLTSRPLRTLINLVPSVTPTPAPAPNLLTLLGAEVLTDEQMAIEIAGYDASSQRKRPAEAGWRHKGSGGGLAPTGEGILPLSLPFGKVEILWSVRWRVSSPPP